MENAVRTGGPYLIAHWGLKLALCFKTPLGVRGYYDCRYQAARGLKIVTTRKFTPRNYTVKSESPKKASPCEALIFPPPGNI